MVFIKAKVYADDDDYQWTDDEASDEQYSSSSDEDDSPKRHTRLDEANIELIEDKEVRSIVEMTNQREKEIFTGKGKKFAYPTEWKSEQGCGRVRLKIHRVVDGLFFRILAMLLVLVDVAMVLVSVIKGNTTANAVVSIVIVSYFLLELLLRIFSWGKTFFKDFLDVFDGIIVVIAFAVTIVIEVLRYTTEKELKWAKIIVILRFARFFLYLRILYHTAQSIYMALRYKATQSKKRYVLEGYDLDLTYITENIIAMSFPSSGIGEIKSMANIKVDFELAIRNPREEVARFFNEKYPDGRYKIYNLCKERGYPIDIFNGQVGRYKIVDHNVPKMSELLEFCKDVESYMNKDKENNVIAVHCKGGKGRTGCCIAAWLVYSGQFKTAKNALDFFGGRRMDVAKGVKFQGVETPSQKRYVKYLEMMMHKMGGKMPPVKELILNTLEVRGLEEEAYSDLRMEIVVGGVVKYPKIKLIPTTTTTKLRKKKIQMTFDGGIKIAGDVKFRFKSKVLGKDYDNCAFFFWLHTSFVEKNKFEADRYHIGNANKPKHNDKYNEQFYVKLTFLDPSKKGSSKKGVAANGMAVQDEVKYSTSLGGTEQEYVVIDLQDKSDIAGTGGNPTSDSESNTLGATHAEAPIDGKPDYPSGIKTTDARLIIKDNPNDHEITATTHAEGMMIIDGKPDYPACTKTAETKPMLIIDGNLDDPACSETAHPDVDGRPDHPTDHPTDPVQHLADEVTAESSAMENIVAREETEMNNTAMFAVSVEGSDTGNTNS